MGLLKKIKAKVKSHRNAGDRRIQNQNRRDERKKTKKDRKNQRKLDRINARAARKGKGGAKEIFENIVDGAKNIFGKGESTGNETTDNASLLDKLTSGGGIGGMFGGSSGGADSKGSGETGGSSSEDQDKKGNVVVWVVLGIIGVIVLFGKKLKLFK